MLPPFGPIVPPTSTLNPQPSTLNPQPSTLNPQPITLNDAPPQPKPLAKKAQRHLPEPSPNLWPWTSANTAANPPTPEPPPPGAREATRPHEHIYILGGGNIGRFLAVTLAKSRPAPAVTLVVNSEAQLSYCSETDVKIVTCPESSTTAPVNVEYWSENPPPRGGGESPQTIPPLHNVIVATKAAQAMPAVDRIRRYLSPGCSVLLAQNGVCRLWPPGVDEYVAERWTRVEDAPRFMTGVVTHGLFAKDYATSVYASPGEIIFGSVSDAASTSEAEASQKSDPVTNSFLARCFLSAPDLHARLTPPKHSGSCSSKN
ncbi:hypothetical protein GQ602_006004 [Ophiocordyceps camponoti-floridani]|uniref:Ketopantoate reductase N-terminal domain-containing protein n=1 Tax=Ophiocordyceps camponoti-floridani TaxID=2030778 RepID=A0A8H4Q2E3_9HYPO|nr:hypothetical protein GQ602_006004 [Ophiocordyceps camponoti-floridani]